MRKGFTLIELLVVVLIMGILASVAMPQYFKSVEKARSAEGIEILSAIASAQERTYMKRGTYEWNRPLHDIGFGNLSYFTITYMAGCSSASHSCYAAVQRTDAAAGGMGRYVLSIYWNEIPNGGARSWACSPTSAGCAAFLPGGKVNRPY